MSNSFHDTNTVQCANEYCCPVQKRTGENLVLLSHLTLTGSASHLATPLWFPSFLFLRLILNLVFITCMGFFIFLVSLIMGYIKLDTYLLYICIKIMFLAF